MLLSTHRVVEALAWAVHVADGAGQVADAGTAVEQNQLPAYVAASTETYIWQDAAYA